MGDLHVHGEQEPGNATMTDTFAAAFGAGGAGLDFVTLVDHNNNVAHDDLKDAGGPVPERPGHPGRRGDDLPGSLEQPGQQPLRRLPGRPGLQPTSPADTQIDDSELARSQIRRLPKDEFAAAQAGGGWTQINHPGLLPRHTRRPAAVAPGATPTTTPTSPRSTRSRSRTRSAPCRRASRSPLDAIAYYEHALDSGAHIAASARATPTRPATDPISPVGAGRDRRLLADGLSKQGDHRRRQGRPHLREAVRDRAGPTSPSTATDADGDDGDHRRLAERQRHRAWRRRVSGITATGRTGDLGPDAAPGRRRDRHDADQRRRDHPELRRLGVGPLRDRGHPDRRRDDLHRGLLDARSG